MWRNSGLLAKRYRHIVLTTGLCFLVGVLITAVVFSQTRAGAAEQAMARAQLLADSVAASLTNALDMGIPLAALVGVDEFFAKSLEQSADVRAIALVDAQDRPLWTVGTPALNESLQVVYAGVQFRSQTVARVVLRWRDAPNGARLALWAVPVMTWLMGICLLALELTRWVAARTLMRRERLLLLAGERLAQGDFGWRFPPARERGHDPRISWLSAEVRHINELFVRTVRLATSLIQTEPDASRQASLKQALVAAQASGGFRGEQIGTLQVTDAQADARFGSTLLGMLVALLLALLTAAQLQPNPWVWNMLAVACALVAALNGAILAIRLRRLDASTAGPLRTAVLWGLLLGFVVLGPALILPWASLLVTLSDSARVVIEFIQIAVGVLAFFYLGAQTVPANSVVERASQHAA